MNRARISVDHSDASVVARELERVESDAALWCDEHRGLAWVDVYDGDRAAVCAKADAVELLLKEAGIATPKVAVAVVADRDWEEAWKEHFHPLRVSPRILVAPTWESCDAPEGVSVVRIDPGMSFGTGQHATTRACIQWLDAMSATHRGACIADVGCGSGIVAICASRLGYRLGDVFDNDEVAVRIAIGNADVNGVHSRCIRRADLAEFVVGERFDMVVANMLAVLLERFHKTIADLLARRAEARLVLGGMLIEQYAPLAELLWTAGLQPCDYMDIEGWRTGRFRWRPAVLAEPTRRARGD